ncbi:MAG: hypothetical protein LBM92_01455 [Opitutaceae bacterium]|jgi:hypothetical protein|nr:hypothetical protein [Opitutaceae bacterium]
MPQKPTGWKAHATLRDEAALAALILLFVENIRPVGPGRHGAGPSALCGGGASGHSLFPKTPFATNRNRAPARPAVLRLLCVFANIAALVLM